MGDGMSAVRVLVIDDDALSREVLALLLSSEGYEVETAESGDAALLHLQAAPDALPAVLLVDLQMPGTAGSELARRLREVCGTGTKLVAMSGSVPEQETRRGFDGFLLKPFTMSTLTAAVGGEAVGEAVGEDDGAGRGGVMALNEGVYRKLAASMRGDKLEQLYELCLADSENRISAMRLSASSGDDAAYRREAHAIRGGCGMVGAVELQTLAATMEARGAGATNDVASLNEFLVACERLRRILVAHNIGSGAHGLSGEGTQ